MKNKLKFDIKWISWYARAWVISLNGVQIETPVFMPVGTRATLKGIDLWLLNDSRYMEHQSNIILSNTFHLHLRPGADTIEKHWWLHNFMNWDKLILTDSWGFQVFSLWLSKNNDDNFKSNKKLVRLHEDYVEFRSPLDWSKHVFTPMGTVDTQRKFGSDIMMMLDVCSPAWDISKRKVYNQMQLTHKRAKIQSDYFDHIYAQSRWVLFPIVQWGLHNDLREESVNYLKQFAKDGIAIWWLSVWESKEDMYRILDFLSEKLPIDIPRYLMWVGSPEEMIYAIRSGIDMFDCVLPTRLGRHGVAMKLGGNMKIKNSKYKNNLEKWLAPWCNCHACKNFTLSYLHHLIIEKEMLWGILLSLHNINYLHMLAKQERDHILADKQIHRHKSNNVE